MAEAAPVVPPAAPQDGPRATRRKPVAANGPTTYEAAYPELHRVAYRAAYRITQNRQRAEDVAQEAMVRVYLKWNKLHDESYQTAFVARVASNLAIGTSRRDATSRRYAPTLEASAQSATTHDNDADLRMHEALRSLPKRQREVVLLRVLADQSEADTAAVLGWSVHSVRHHLAAAIDALRVRAVADLIAVQTEAAAPAGSAVAAVEAGAQRRTKQRKVRGVVAGAIAFVVAAIGSGLFSVGAVQFRPDEANDKRNQTTTTTTTVAPGTPTTVIIGPDGTPVVVPVAPGGAANGAAPGPAGSGSPSTPVNPVSGDTPEPAGPVGVFPDASTTGVLPGSTLLPMGGSTITTPGTVIENRRIAGCVSIEASNVTIRNSVIQGDCYYILMVSGSVSGVVLDRVDIDGRRAPIDATCVQGSNFTMNRTYVHACRLGVVPERNVTIQESYIAQVRSSAVRCFSCANIVVTRSNVESAGATAGAVDLGDDNGPIGAFTLTSTRLNGGNSTLRGGWNQGAGREPASLIVTDNVFGPDHTDSPYLFVGPRTLWARNVLEGSNQPLTL